MAHFTKQSDIFSLKILPYLDLLTVINPQVRPSTLFLQGK